MKVFLLILVCASHLLAGAKNSIMGYSGLIITPTADILRDGELTGTVGRLPKLYAENYSRRNYDRTAFVASLGFMPFVEASFGFIRPDDFTGGVGDRTVTLRFKVLNERSILPSIALGFHDFFAVESFDLEPAAAQHFAALYLVGTKQFHFSDDGALLLLNMGYGLDWLPANDSHLQGLFAGLQYSPINDVALLLEYDSVNINAGLRFDFFSHVHYTLSFWQLDYIMHQLSFSINLK